jgi:hypothetical protein
VLHQPVISSRITKIPAGFSLMVAALNALFRDVEHLLQALLLPWFFLTPILYSLEELPGVDDYPAAEFALHWVNFLTPPIEAMRAVRSTGIRRAPLTRFTRSSPLSSPSWSEDGSSLARTTGSRPKSDDRSPVEECVAPRVRREPFVARGLELAEQGRKEQRMSEARVAPASRCPRREPLPVAAGLRNDGSADGSIALLVGVEKPA